MQAQVFAGYQGTASAVQEETLTGLLEQQSGLLREARAMVDEGIISASLIRGVAPEPTENKPCSADSADLFSIAYRNTTLIRTILESLTQLRQMLRAL